MRFDGRAEGRSPPAPLADRPVDGLLVSGAANPHAGRGHGSRPVPRRRARNSPCDLGLSLGGDGRAPGATLAASAAPDRGTDATGAGRGGHDARACAVPELRCRHVARGGRRRSDRPMGGRVHGIAARDDGATRRGGGRIPLPGSRDHIQRRRERVLDLARAGVRASWSWPASRWERAPCSRS